MSIQAKVSPLAQSVNSAAPIAIPDNGILTLTQSSNIVLDIAPESVTSYTKSGADLIVQLKSGESLRIANFYVEGQPVSQLYLVDRDKLLAVDLPPVAADGPLLAGYVPQETAAGFESLTGADGTIAGLSPGAALLAGAAIIGSGVAIANSNDGGGGGGGGDGSVPPDTTAPAPASGLQIAPDGSSISGTAEPGATVGIDSNGDGQTDVSVVVGPDGKFQIPLNPPLTNGETVTVVVTDPAGNSSPPATVQAPDFPDAPQINPSNGSSLSGTAEPGSTVVLTDGNGNPIGQTTADGNGNWSYTPDSPLPDGTVVKAVVVDAAGNSGPPASIIIDGVAPAAPVINPSNGTELSGTAEPNSTVTLTDGSGNPIGQVTADGNGNWSYTPATPLPDGTVVNAVAQDAAGNTSGQGSTTVDSVAPGAPTIDLSDGSSLSGTAEPNSTVTLTDGSGNPIGQVTADGSGNWSYTPATPLPDGTVINVVAQDAAGNTSAPTSTIVDAQAPAAPVVNPSNGTTISGTAEPGSTVTLTDAGGNPIGQVTADGSGNWSFTPGSPLPNGTVVNATATDPTGNTSAPSSTTVDSVAPAAPVVQPSNGSEISGTAEPGSTITLTDGSGNPIGQTTADGSGNWSFTPGTPLPDGSVVNATATDPAGNTSGQGSTTVDGVAPGVPTIDLSNGSSLSGTAEPNSTVTLTDGSGNPIGEATADGSGNWTFTPATPLPNGTVVNATASDPAGNTSPAATVTVDSSAPAAPVINPTNGATISGTAEAGATVTLTDLGGNPIAQVTADGSGNWSFTPGLPLANGTVIIATATDPTGNTGPQAATTVDSVAPAAPVVEPSNGSEISGTAEPGSTVILTDGSGNPIGQTTADGNGDWSFTPTTPLANGTVVNAVAQDPAGNTGPQGSTTVDSIAPAAPVVNPSNGAVINGTAEPNSTVTLTDGNGNAIGEVTADGSGNWTFTPGTQLPNGTVVNATATDAAGNTGAPGSTTVDSSLPSIPQVDPSNGSVISGTADAGNTIILTDGNGNPIGQVTADGTGNWSFTPGIPLPDGTVVNAVARNPGGTDSAPAVITVDGVAPAAPVVEPSNGTEISGTAEAGATVILTDGGGNPIGQTTADGSGNWSFTPGTPLVNGTVINAVAQDAAGNTSTPQVSTTVDAVAPGEPTIEPSNGTEISGTAEAGAKVILTDGNGNPIGETTADGSGNWSFTPGTPLANGTVINAVAQDPAGNTSGPSSVTVDAIAPAAPTIEPSNGVVLTGTAEPGATVILTDGGGNPIGETTADGSGDWSFTPTTPLANGTVVNAVAEDAAGNSSGPASTTVDSVAPSAPLLSISADGALLTGTAEPNSQVRLVIDGDTANPITVNVDGAGNFSLPLAPPLITGELISGVTADAAGNISGPATINAPDLAPPTISVPEAADTWINAAEISDGIQVDVTIRPTMQVGQVITVAFAGQNGYETQATHTITAGDILAGSVTVTIPPGGGMGPFPEGASTVTADINGGTASISVPFTIDTIPPATPVLSLVGSILTISTDPGTELTVEVDIGGVTATATVTADNSGLASLNLLTDLDIDLTLDQLLNAQVSVTGEDPAGNTSNVATIGVGGSIEQPVTIGNFGVDVSLNPLNPRFGFSGTTEPDSSVVIRVITPALNVELLPIQADSSGNFSLNLLSPTVLTQLGLNITDILNLGSQISFNIVATDTNGNDSSAYGITLAPNGLSLNIGQIDVNGTAGDDVMSGSNGSSEHINGGDGNDLIFNVGTGDQVVAGDGNDAIQITATNFTSIDGGAGFDTLILADGIDLDYNAVGVGTLSNIERIDLGKGDSGSVLTLTAAEVDAITDSNNILQITGESNDTLNVVGAVNTGTTQQLNGITYDVYNFGSSTLLIEDNTVQVVV